MTRKAEIINVIERYMARVASIGIDQRPIITIFADKYFDMDLDSLAEDLIAVSEDKTLIGGPQTEAVKRFSKSGA